MMRMTFPRAVAILGSFIVGSLAPATPSESGVASSSKTSQKSETAQVQAAAFLSALLAHNEKALLPYGPSFFVSGSLDPVVSDFLYKSEPKKRSVLEIAADGALKSIIVPQRRDKTVIIIFVPEKYKAKTKSLNFLETGWMRHYFACQFDISRPQWKLVYNFCFAETDGPYYTGGE